MALIDKSEPLSKIQMNNHLEEGPLSNSMESSTDPKGRFLKAGVTRSTFLAFLFSAMMAIAGLVFLNADQTYIMVDILDYPRERVGDAAGSLVLADELMALFMVSIWGAISDRITRRLVFSLGFVFMSISIALHPWAHSVFPTSVSSFPTSLLAFRLIFSIGASASTAMLTALIGDYSRPDTRAKVAGIVGFSTGVGALFSAVFLSRLPTFFLRDSTLVPGSLRHIPNGGATLIISFSICAILLLITAIISATFITTPPEINLGEDGQEGIIPLSKRISIGMRAGLHPLIALAYASGFVARADSIALTLFVAPWVDKYLTLTGQCPPTNPAVLTRCQPAKRLASTLMSVSHTAMLLGAPLFGIFSDRLGPINAILIPAGCGMISFGMLTCLRDPRSALAYLSMGLAGLADIGMIITSMALMAAVSSSKHRGTLAGTYSFFGALGIIVTSKLGGFLFDRVRETAAFAVVQVASLIVFIGALLCIANKSSINVPLKLE